MAVVVIFLRIVLVCMRVRVRVYVQRSSWPSGYVRGVGDVVIRLTKLLIFIFIVLCFCLSCHYPPRYSVLMTLRCSWILHFFMGSDG